MKFRFAAACAAFVAALAGAAFGPKPVSIATPHAAIAKTCSAGYTHAVLPWGHKCLRVGEYCKHSADPYYHRYGYHCHSRDSRGDYHLTY